MHSDSQVPESSNRFAADLELVRTVVSGSTSAWHALLERYSGLIYSVIRRHLVTEDIDDIRSVYVDVLKDLYDGGLGKYRGEAALSTWLIVTTRSRTIDALRKKHGRMRAPSGYERLGEFDKRVLQLFYIDRLPMEIVLHMLEWGGEKVAVDDVVVSIRRIERTLPRRYLDRLDEEHAAKRLGTASPETLTYLVQQQLDIEGRVGDAPVREKRLAEVTRRLEEAVSALSPEERRLVQMRFERRLSARKIADELELTGPRRAYVLIERVIRKLRRVLGDPDR